MYSFIFMRHGRSLADDEERHEGRYDSPLTEVGIEQAKQTAHSLIDHGIKAIICSPLQRAKQTAQIISEKLKVSIEESILLMERDNGVLAGLPFYEAKEKYPEPERSSIYRKFPNKSGENNIELNSRALLCLDYLLSKEPGKYLIISHGNMLNCIVKRILDMPMDSNTVFKFTDNGYIELNYEEEKDIWIFKGMK